MKSPAMLVSISLVALAGCASRPPVILPPLDEAAYQPFAADGTATVTGSSFLVTKGGDIKKGAARQVFLIPETTFLTARMNEADNWYSTYEWLGFSGTPEDTIAKAWRHTRIAVADVDGRFVFKKVPAGKYVVETQLFWQYMSCGMWGCKNVDTGAVLRKRLEVTDGASIDAQLTSAVNR
jgi:predicted small lipoprotein YifL